MAQSSVLREFIVKLGFKVDETQFKNFQTSMGSIGKGATEVAKQFVQIGTAVAGTAVAAAVGLNKIAKPLESLYFAAQRTGASANELKSLTGAFEQIGVSAEETKGAIEAFSQARRSMPGIDQIFRIDPKQTDNAKAFLQVLSQLANEDTGGAYTHAIAAQKAAMVGISEQTLTQFENNRGEFVKELRNREKIVNKFDVGKMAKTGHQFNEAFRDTKENVELTADKIATGVMPAAEKVLGVTSDLADLYNKIDDKTGGWLGHLTAVAGVSTSILTTYKAIAALRGVVGGAAVAEGAGTAATAAGGGGLLAVAGGLVAPVVAAVIGSHFLDKATKGTFWDTDQQAGAGDKQTGLADQLAWLKGKLAPTMSTITAGMADFVAGFEGHAKNGYGVYKDVAGNDTVGIGHKVRPGEDFSGGLDKQGAMALLGRDLAAASDAVKRLVHVALTGNQTKALTDFVFNLGAGKLEKSTLLKELNAGHYQAAADQFKYWDKAMNQGHLVSNEGLARRRAAEAQTFNTPDAKPNVTISQKTDIHIDAGPNAQSTADKIAKSQGRVNGDLVRNLSGVTS